MGYRKLPSCHCHVNHRANAGCHQPKQKSHPMCRCAHALELGGIQAQLRSVDVGELENGLPIIFDIILKRTSPDIIYNKDNGKFTLCKSGTYHVNWDVAVEGSYFQPFVTLALTADDEIINAATLPITVGQLSSTAMVTVTDNPVDIALINNTNDVIQLSRYAPVANITITKITSGCKVAPEPQTTNPRPQRHHHHHCRPHHRHHAPPCRCCK